MKTRYSDTGGSALVVALFSSTILAVLAGAMITKVMTRRQTLNQASAWEEALLASDAGVHQALAQLERSLQLNANFIPTGTQEFTLSLPHAGESGMNCSVTYKMRQQQFGADKRPYYEVLSTGTVQTSGAKRVSDDAADLVLRKLSFANNKTMTTRRIHAVIKPSYSSDGPLQTKLGLTMNNHNIVIDSFDSTNPNRSVNGITAADGTYSNGQPSTLGYFNSRDGDPLPANIASNSTFIQAGDATVYGDALTNGGVVGNDKGIKGEIRDDFDQPFAPVYAPSWAVKNGSGINTGVQVAGNGNGNNVVTSTTLSKSATFYGGTKENPNRYYMDSIKLNGGDQVVFDFGKTASNNTTGNVDPTKKYIEIYVNGAVSTSGGGNTGDGAFTIINGVYVTFWVVGNFNLGGNGLQNNNGIAATLTINMVDAPTAPTSQTVTLAGSSKFYGTVYAPSADLKLAGGGSDGTMVGALVGKSAFLNGNTQIRYDESLSNRGQIQKFGIVSWFEDTQQGGAAFF